ncbi:MAG: carboxypeptidase-like regulatory domain-containing protein [Pirellulaceae bacterium]|nr:carboxypeptidase-like regulatory domain-containing protein [Pirellulaceae bacterium]
MFFSRARLCLLSAALLFVAGCGNGLTPITGVVTMDDKPLPNAIVTFFPVDGGSAATGKTDDKGNYKLIGVLGEGLKPGSYKVSVTTAETTAVAESSDIDMNSPEYLAMSSGVGMESVKTSAPKEKIPAKYNTATELLKQITNETAKIDLPLTSK